MLRKLQRGDTRRIGNGNNNVNLDPRIGELPFRFLCQGVSHRHSGSVDGDAVHRGIRTSKVDVFKDIRGELGRSDELPTRHGRSGNDDCLSGLDVFPVCETQGISHNGLGRDQVIHALAPVRGDGFPRRESHGADSIRITEPDQPEAGEHPCTRVGALGRVHEVSDGGEDVFFVDSEFAGLLEVVREHVEEDFRVRVGVDVPVCFGVEVLAEFVGVDKVAVLVGC